MKPWMWITIGIILLVALGFWATTNGPKQPIQGIGAVSTSTVLVATTTPVVATSTASQSKQPTSSALWTSYLKAFSCTKITVAATAKVHSFSVEGATVSAGTEQAYKCSNGGNWIF